MDPLKHEEKIVDSSGNIPQEILQGRVDVESETDQIAPLGQSMVKMMLELKVSGCPISRSGLDLVVVLEANGMKLERMKEAMLFVIRKLTPKDRLSVVSFNSFIHPVCGLRLMTDSFKPEIENDVKALKPGDGTNISEGLRLALLVLNKRQFTGDRVGAIMLISSGEEDRGDAARQKNIDTVPVFTFGFGSMTGARVLRNIAKNSQGGTYSDVTDLDSLNSSLAQILAGLVTVTAQDVQLTLEAVNSTRTRVVSPVSYAKNSYTESLVTFLFGSLSNKEKRKVMVELHLPASKEGDMLVLEITSTYRAGGKLFTQDFIVYVRRESQPVLQEKERMMLENKRIEITKLMREAREWAERSNFDEAQRKLREAQGKLPEGVGDESAPLINTLKYELYYMLNSFVWENNKFKQIGLPFALSSESSHECQRFAARGDHSQVRLFATPRMSNYLQQSIEFFQNPNMNLETAEGDAKIERAASPLLPIAGAITCQIKSAIHSLNSVANIVKARL